MDEPIQSFDALLTHSLTRPYDWESEWGLHERGKHRSFKGRPYRRGKNRCGYCGAFLSIESVIEKPPPYKNAREQIAHNMMATNPLLNWLKGKTR